MSETSRTVGTPCEALAQASAKAEDDAGLRDALFARGRLHLAQGRDDEAEDAFLSAAEIDEREGRPKRPPFILPLVELRALYAQHGRHAEAAVMAERVLKRYGPGRLSPRDEAILTMDHGRELLASGDRVRARSVLARALDILSRAAVSDSEALVATVKELIANASAP